MTSRSSLAIIILAAGQGKRMKSAIPKVMHEVAGRPMISWVIEAAETLEPDQIVIVTAPDMDDVRTAVSPHKTVIQKEQNGTGDAVKPAMEELKDFEGQILILLGDEPLVDPDILQEMIRHDGCSVMGVIPPSNYGLGRLLLEEDGTLERIVEEKDCSPAERDIEICNAGNFCFPATSLKIWLNKLQNNNKQNEYYLTDIPEIAKKEGVKTKVFTTETDIGWGINTRIELAEHNLMAQRLLRDYAMDNGVTMIDPDTVTLSWDTEFGQDIILEPNVYFGPGVTVADHVTIHAFSHIEGAAIFKGASIGPFARIRPKSSIGEGAAIGNFIEINRSHIAPKAKAKHVSYIGDADIKENVNIGAGTIIANYDGFLKHNTVIEKDVFVGSNTTIIAPVHVGEGAIIAAGSNINKDIPKNAMAIGRSRQENHEGWASEYRVMKTKAVEEQK